MEAVEFIKQKDRMCDYYSDRQCTHDGSGETCPAMSIDCEITSDELERLVAIVERWVKEHPGKPEQEQKKPEQEQQKPEHPEEAADVTKPKQDEQSCGNNALEERVDHLEKCFDEMNERLTCFIHDTVDEVQAIKKLAEHQDEFMQTKCVHVDSEEVESMNEPKRTNKDVLLAKFPDALMDNNGIPYACPNRLDAHYNCDKFENCFRCRHIHWLAEVEE